MRLVNGLLRAAIFCALVGALIGCASPRRDMAGDLYRVVNCKPGGAPCR